MVPASVGAGYVRNEDDGHFFVYSDVLTRIECLVSPCFRHRSSEVEEFLVNIIGRPSMAMSCQKVQIYMCLLQVKKIYMCTGAGICDMYLSNERYRKCRNVHCQTISLQIISL